MGRKQLYYSDKDRQVWVDAENAAEADGCSLSALAVLAVREYLTKRAKRLSRTEPAAQ